MSRGSRHSKVIKLTQDLLRVRCRESLRAKKLIVPGGICQYTFDGFTFFSRRIRKGSRLPELYLRAKIFNSGGPVADETDTGVQTAHITLYLESNHESYLEFPMAK